MRREDSAPGLESFWETCDNDGIADHPLVRELCFRLDAIQRYRELIADAEANGQDEAVELLSSYFNQQHALVARIQDVLARNHVAV
jgi:ferritin-like metal-binding protein YciE